MGISISNGYFHSFARFGLAPGLFRPLLIKAQRSLSHGLDADFRPDGLSAMHKARPQALIAHQADHGPGKALGIIARHAQGRRRPVFRSLEPFGMQGADRANQRRAGSNAGSRCFWIFTGIGTRGKPGMAAGKNDREGLVGQQGKP